MVESQQQKIKRLVQEQISIVAYDPRWPEMFLREKKHLLSCLPTELIRRIEHFGSTEVPGLAASLPSDRTAYTHGKSEFIRAVMQEAKLYFAGDFKR